MCPLHLEPPSHLPPHPIPLGGHRAQGLNSLHHTANSHWLSHFTYGNEYVSVLFSQFTPPTPFPPMSAKSVLCVCFSQTSILLSIQLTFWPLLLFWLIYANPHITGLTTPTGRLWLCQTSLDTVGLCAPAAWTEDALLLRHCCSWCACVCAAVPATSAFVPATISNTANAPGPEVSKLYSGL